MSKQQRYILAFAILALLGIMIFKREYVYTFIIEPIAHILWLFYRTLLSVDQKIYWLLLIFTLLPIIIRLLPETTEYSIKPVYKYSHPENDRVRYWETLIRTAEGDKHERLRLQLSLQALSQSIENLSFRNDPGVILLPSIKSGFPGWIKRLIFLSPLSRFILRKKEHSVSNLEKGVDQILKTMEQTMEGNHD